MSVRRRIRFGAILEQRQQDGGAFQQAVNELVRIAKLLKITGDELVVISFFPETVALLRDLEIEALVAKPSLLDIGFYGLQLTTRFNFAQKLLKWSSPYELKLKRLGIDVVIFLTQSKWFLLLEDTLFIMTVFDNCHRDAPEFPEARSFGEFERREWFYRTALNKAVFTVVDCCELSRSLEDRYGLDGKRVVIIPFEPSVFVRSSEDGDAASVLAKYGLEPGYLFYPAQFWPHKNHSTLLRAMELIRGRSHPHLRLVLCGTDNGGLQRIQRLSNELGLDGAVSILGFVPSEELRSLYSQSAALVMTTYFGPTNLPPLEAWACGTPVVYPEAFSTQVGDAAILFDYDSAESLAGAIEALLQPGVRAKLVAAGTRMLAERHALMETANRNLLGAIERLRNRLAAIS
jgi:glycosyltransferase involved in cell wall biosynthesis